MGEVARAGSGRGGGGDPVLKGAIDVDVASTDLVAGAEEALRARDLLTAEERAGCEAFPHEAERRRALVTFALVRMTLSRHAQIATSDWRFERGPYGRPEIAAPAGTGLRFNLSHTRELVVCAVTETADIGVDAEAVAAHPDMSQLAASVMSDEEFAEFETSAEPSRPAAFAAAWTLKEAYLKARGLGLALSPRAVSFDLRAPGVLRARFSTQAGDDPAAWWFASWDEPPAHVVSVALRTRGTPSRVQVRRLVSFDGRAETAGRLLRSSR